MGLRSGVQYYVVLIEEGEEGEVGRGGGSLLEMGLELVSMESLSSRVPKSGWLILGGFRGGGSGPVFALAFSRHRPNYCTRLGGIDPSYAGHRFTILVMDSIL